MSKDAKQYGLDYSSRDNERWALLKGLKLGQNTLASRVRYIVETVASIAGDGELQWTLQRLAERLSAAERTLSEDVLIAEECGLLVGRRMRTHDSQLSRKALKV